MRDWDYEEHPKKEKKTSIWDFFWMAAAITAFIILVVPWLFSLKLK